MLSSPASAARTPAATASSPMYRCTKPRISPPLYSSAHFSSNRRTSSIRRSRSRRCSRPPAAPPRPGSPAAASARRGAGSAVPAAAGAVAAGREQPPHHLPALGERQVLVEGDLPGRDRAEPAAAERDELAGQLLARLPAGLELDEG